MTRNRFIIAFLLVLVYEILMGLINPFGLSFTKVAITLLVWIAFLLTFLTFVFKYPLVRSNMPDFAFYIFIALIGWNFINILRSLLFDEGSLTTLFGNSRTSLALLIPFTITFGFDKTNLRKSNDMLVYLVITGIMLYILYRYFAVDPKNIPQNVAFLVLISIAAFFINLIPFQPSRIKIVTFLGAFLLFYLSFITGIRTMMLKIILLFLSIIPVYLFRQFKSKLVYSIVLISLIIPFYLLQKSLETGQSPFERVLSELTNRELSVDTRTFLYVEVYSDLKEAHSLVTGKGSNGTYYSPYFDETGEDTENRLSVEVGILALLLKGGIISIILYLTLSIAAVYHALFHSNNYIVMSLGFMILLHILILFIANSPDYSVYNYLIWFFTGVCLSKEIRMLSDTEIKTILFDAK